MRANGLTEMDGALRFLTLEAHTEPNDAGEFFISFLLLTFMSCLTLLQYFSILEVKHIVSIQC